MSQGQDQGEPVVYWLDERVLRDELRVEPVRQAGIPLPVWLATIHDKRMTVEPYPGAEIVRERGVVGDGAIVRVQHDLAVWAFGVPVEAILALAELMEPEDYRALRRMAGLPPAPTHNEASDTEEHPR